MQLKDIVKIVILSVIAFVLEMAGGYLSMVFGPYMLFVNHSLASLIVAPVFFTLCHKVPKRGTLFLYYLIIGIIYSIIGFWPMIFILLLTAIAAELIIGKVENYVNDGRITLTFVIAQTIFALHGLIFFLVLKPSGMQKVFPDMFTPEMVDTLSNFYGKFVNVLAVMAIQVVVAYIGARFGIYVYRKFFSKKDQKQSVLD
ncbi:MAG: MptD family putative ECF transporter S component [Tissierellia bacterium]|nr:MptD family putative ECF transporter S component [Tissierellia bacterium]